MTDSKRPTNDDQVATDLAHAKAREAALREILDVISQSRSDEAPVFETILDNAQVLCDAPMAGLVLATPGDKIQTLAAHRNIKSDTVERFRSGNMPLDGTQSYAAKSILNGELIHLADMKESELYRANRSVVRFMVDDIGIRSVLFVPLMSKDAAIGTITLFRYQVSPFSDSQVALVETFAEQAVIAIENVRQFREVQKRLDRETATSEILEVIARSRDDEGPVFAAILEAAARLCNAPLAFLPIANEAHSHVTVPAFRGVRAEFAEALAEFNEPMAGSDLVAVRVIAEAKVIRSTDLINDPAYAATGRWRTELTETEGARSVLLVPLLQGGKAIGAIMLYRREVNAFSDDDVALVQSFASQAVIAIENVRQFRELRSRLEREAATREILEVISQSRADELPVLQAIVSNAARLCEATVAGVWLVDTSSTSISYASIWGPDQEVFKVGYSVDLDSPVQVAVSIREARIIHTHDLKDDPLYVAGDPIRTKVVDEAGVRTFLTVPLIRNGVAFGCINLNRFEVRPFDEGDIALVETFAEQAVIAIENVRQFREVQARLEREQAVKNILRVISESPDDEQPTFEAILDSATRLCGSPFASLVLGRKGDAAQRRVAHRQSTPESQALYRDGLVPMDPHDSLAAQAILDGHTIHVPDMAETEGYRSGHERFLLLVDHQGLRTNLFVPLLGPEGGIGCFILWKKEVAPFTADQITLMETFAAHAVIAIENVRQFKALEDRTAEVETLNTSLEQRVETQVDQLERLGRLRRFLSPQVADAVVSSGTDALLGSHRAMIAILFCDIRGFTAFCESAEPEEAIEVLQTYHQELGKLIHNAGAGFDHRAGDGIMVIFNDPIRCDDPAGDALRCAIAMRDRMVGLCADWRKLGHRLGFGVGISLGYATVGMVGFEGRYDYTASGSAVNLGSRLCDQAEDGEILLSPRAALAVEDIATLEPAGDLTLKGFHTPVVVNRVTGLKEVI